jgi:hypothetical protein
MCGYRVGTRGGNLAYQSFPAPNHFSLSSFFPHRARLCSVDELESGCGFASMTAELFELPEDLQLVRDDSVECIDKGDGLFQCKVNSGVGVDLGSDIPLRLVGAGCSVTAASVTNWAKNAENFNFTPLADLDRVKACFPPGSLIKVTELELYDPLPMPTVVRGASDCSYQSGYDRFACSLELQ